MKFIYEYRTSDNSRHTGVVCASSRDSAYSLLKKQGIKPSRLADAPGLANLVIGKGKRWIAIVLLAVLVCSLAFVILSGGSDDGVIYSFDSKLRRQPIGDAAIIDQGVRTGWESVFSEEGERFLASFAVPGVPAGLRNTSVQEIEKALSRRVEVLGSDGIEARQIKSMVEGMKEELRQFLAQGGSIKRYGEKLVRRQEEEIGYYNRAKNEIECAQKSGMSKTQLEALWENRNASLRAMGVKLVTMPE